MHKARAIYREIVPSEKIVFDEHFLDDNGKTIESLPSKHTTIIFDEAGDQTELVINVQLRSAAERQKLVGMGFTKGFPAALNQLTSYIKTIH
jgi:uncharacterized protein YndB with AHSA1/START domain